MTVVKKCLALKVRKNDIRLNSIVYEWCELISSEYTKTKFGILNDLVVQTLSYQNSTLKRSVRINIHE